ncbi:MAG TPA: class I SAM-dependent methyltransferase [Anaerolineaceae bacterium]|nr:class I SAM-dependent methyltransferase [Anaerolineaceae bacterium]
MNTYKSFARHYQNSPYSAFTNRIICEIFPHWLEVLDFSPSSLLDLACGAGEFAIAQAKAGLEVVGLDQSDSLLQLAEVKAVEEGAKVRWVHADMSHFSLAERFDCVTCWFDSLNYLVKIEDLANCFKAAYAHLNPGGYFLFDMNTIFGLVVEWQRNQYVIQQETPDYLEICAKSCDYENNIAEMRIIMFEKQVETWARHEELHTERGYALDDVVLLLQNAGFSMRYLVGNPLLMRPLETDDSRLFMAVSKP